MHRVSDIKIFTLKGWYFKRWSSGKLIEKKRWNASQNATVTVFALNGLWPQGIPTPYRRVETKALATVVNLKEPQIIIIQLCEVVSADQIWAGGGGGGVGGGAVF